MKKPYCEVEFYLIEAGCKSRCQMFISEPELAPEGDAVCVVKLIPLLSDEKRIFGFDEQQARQLSIDFVKVLLASRTLEDLNGRRIELSGANSETIFKLDESTD